MRPDFLECAHPGKAVGLVVLMKHVKAHGSTVYYLSAELPRIRVDIALKAPYPLQICRVVLYRYNLKLRYIAVETLCFLYRNHGINAPLSILRPRYEPKKKKKKSDLGLGRAASKDRELSGCIPDAALEANRMQEKEL
jgi:hypothetical protein